MKKRIHLFLWCSILMLTCIQYALAQSTLPGFEFQGLHANSITESQLSRDQASMIILFDPYCDICNKQAESISQSMDQLKGITQLWVSSDPDEDAIKQFISNHQFTNKNDMLFCTDQDYRFDEYFGYSDSPLRIILFDNSRLLQAEFTNETSTKKILSLIDNQN